MNEQLFTIAEVGKKLKLSRTSMYYLMKSGKLVGMQIGRSWRFTQSDIDRFLALVRTEGGLPPMRKL